MLCRSIRNLRELNANCLLRFYSAHSDVDVIVIGGGHAGCEGAAAAARCGSRVVLLTHSSSTIGEMSCNPSFGGIGKGHLIREIDALDGVCARICDNSAITYQALNSGQGPAVLGLRAQIDRKLYKAHMQKEISSTQNLDIVEGNVEALSTENNNGESRVSGVILDDGTKLRAKAVVIATGTFLGGEIFLGKRRWPAGRIGEKSATGLSKSFHNLGFRLSRLRTGTPPRLLMSSIDFSKFETMPPDEEPIPFSFMTDRIWLPPDKQLPTYLGYTNDSVRDIVEDNLADNEHVKAEASGPRYCPSLESKVIRFRNLHHRVKTKKHKGLFLAGQINGTTGYEEAAAQGVIAGINAAARARDEEGMVIRRSQAYIGVLIDDLTSLGTNEPYRMFTSRAEHRLHLRPDNADMRLTEIGRQWGAVGDSRWSRFQIEKEAVQKTTKALKEIRMSLQKWTAVIPGLQTKNLSKVLSAYDMIYRHNVPLSQLMAAFPERLTHCMSGDQARLEKRLKVEASYEGARDRMKVKMDEIDSESSSLIPENIDYGSLKGLSMECREKLDRARPLNLAAASRIPGVKPDAIITLLRYLKRQNVVSQST
ncbi:tRNA uridine 5-carboxymethylaminomethyl modification enzyme GidA [Ancylostoma caninum]|uniref:tRNA uridine 5-carboxymethylaminomethyl modification enzyme GidA n=1 Tax=Ancylostoma caninum TaxID=29170 RepID=A0A368FLA4_ANCCA|nr:tRNA uridine 5-carboxymethylaminomethyl modification enzyme GidA [Ancylostoma caninum]